MKIRVFSVCAAAVWLCTACSSEDGLKEKETEQEPVIVESRGMVLSADEQEIVDVESTFATKFFAAAYNEENLVFSPLSASCNLSLLANAATGETRAQLLDVLGYDDIESLNALNHRMLSELGALDKDYVHMSIANSVWLNTLLKVSIAPEFENAAAMYCAPVSSCLFDDNTHNVVNRWIEDNTGGLIKNMYKAGDIKPAVDMTLLVNALYFNGKFATKFDKEKTASKRFYSLDGRKEYTTMMSGKFTVPYMDNERLSACSLKFGNSAFELVVAMPKEGCSLIDAATEALSLEKTNKLEISVTMPKFEHASRVDFKEIYRKLGVKTLDACFDNIRSAYTDIDFQKKFETHQKTSFSVDEDGAVGASSSSTIIGVILSPTPVGITFDHPFVYMVREKASGAIVLMGAYVNS